MRGGIRHGAGRPSTGRKPASFYITQEEEKTLRECLALIRADAGGAVDGTTTDSPSLADKKTSGTMRDNFKQYELDQKPTA